MNFHVLLNASRYAVIELEEDAVYETAGYEVWVNNELRGVFHKMVQLIDDLEPDTDYEISVVRNADASEIVTIHTMAEKLTLNVRDFGAYGDGVHDDTAAIQAAILCAPDNARILIDRGVYRVTALFLKSNLIIDIKEGAVLEGIYDRERTPVLPGMTEYEKEDGYYNIGSWEGNPIDSFASMITGINVSNVIICGRGTLNGKADFTNWWMNCKVKDRAWRPRMVFLNNCDSIVLAGITVMNSPAWNIHPYFSRKIRLLDMDIKGPANSHNTDGCDPESCDDVEIAGVHFSVGDDCIAIKSGKIYMGRTKKVPSKNIRIRQSFMQDGHAAVTAGSEIAAGVNNVSVKDCLFSNTDRGLRVKTRRGRGKDSVLTGIVFENIIMDGVKTPFVVNSFYFCDPDGHSEYVASQEALPVDERTPEIGSLVFKNIKCRNTHFCGAYIYGLPEKKIESVEFSNVEIDYAADAQTGVAAMMEKCEPSSKKGMVFANIKKLVINNVKINGQKGEAMVFTGVDKVIS